MQVVHVLIRTVLPIGVALLLPVLASAAADQLIHGHSNVDTASAADAPIKVTINPEARVSVALVGPLPAPVRCGEATDFLVTILNHGFVTANLEARLVGGVPPGVRFQFRSEPLNGVPRETRRFQITLTRPGPTDITIAFTTHNNVPDLAGRDRIHLLLRCNG